MVAFMFLYWAISWSCTISTGISEAPMTIWLSHQLGSQHQFVTLLASLLHLLASLPVTMGIKPLRGHALSIPIPSDNGQVWHAPRPPTPRRPTCFQADAPLTMMVGVVDLDAPPVPPLSYWEPDTPGSRTSPLWPTSPHNPFLVPPSPPSIEGLFPMASPVLPASPLSIFDRLLSPMTPTFLFPRTPPNPLSPKSLAARTQIIPLPVQAERWIAEAHSSLCYFPLDQLEKARYEKIHALLEVVREKVIAEMALKKQDAAAETVKSKGLDSILEVERKQKRPMKKFSRKGVETTKGMIVNV